MKLLLDEHVNPAIARGLLRLNPDLQAGHAGSRYGAYGSPVGYADTLEVALVAQTLAGTPDPELLEWAAENGYLLVSEDRNTLVGFYYERQRAGLHSQGLFIVRRGAGMGEVIETLGLIVRASAPEDWANQVTYIPL